MKRNHYGRLHGTQRSLRIRNTDCFDGCSRPRSRDRYFVAPDPSHCGDDTLLTPQCDGDEVALEEPCIAPERHFLSPYKNIRNVLRHRTHTPSDRGVQFQPEFLPMSVEADEEHHISFAEDRRPGNVPSDEPPLVCPDTLEEMLHIVSNGRQDRIDVLRDYQVQAARSYVAADQSEDSEGCMYNIYRRLPALW